MEEKKIVTLKIDGHEIKAEKGTPIIKLAEELGIKIPTLCHSDLLESYGSCRVCSVELRKRKRKRLVTACNYPAQDGDEIFTDTELVRENRKLIFELLLARCPDVPIIQEMAKEYGVEKTRFEKTYQNCIVCGLCARMCNDVVGANAIGWGGRGVDREITTPFQIDTDACIGCGACASVCPTGHIIMEPIWKQPGEPREFFLGPHSAVYIPTFQAVPKVPVIDEEACIHFKTGGCKICEQVCEPQAINHEMEESIEEIEVGQILVATGYNIFDSRKMAQYSYGQLDNVYSGLEIEYMLNSTGPTEGKVLLKNGKEPKVVGIIHCVGSRDENYHPYCSRVCCMYALKFAHLIKERTPAEVYQFYIDMRSFGKGYEEFYSRVLVEGVNVIRGKVAEVVRSGWSKQEEGALFIRCEDTLIKKYREIPVDMVILCNALEPQADADKIQRLLSLSFSPDGFFLEKHPKLDPTATATDGIYIAGCCQGPKDIPDTVAQASSAAARILANISKGEVEIEPIQTFIDPELCAGCRLCNNLCPYGAVSFIEEENISRVNEALCKGCGTCVASCPSSAAVAKHFSDKQIFAEIEGILK
ncbi:MAG: 4Fe-4S dicluster domain-containing protein [Candidatus Aminicenantes bacterium]|nr:MAG: 4Fe-4S dicluster domain-containing protein [Candidatus Aminicenantes bacterium]